jgi:hypothetical protein
MTDQRPKRAPRVLPRVGLNRAAKALLKRVESTEQPAEVFGQEKALARARAREAVGPLIDGAGLPLTREHQYHWLVNDLAELMRTRTRTDLARCMGLVMSRWLNFGLEPNTVTLLASELFDRLHPARSAVPAATGGGP